MSRLLSEDEEELNEKWKISMTKNAILLEGNI